MTRQLDLVVLIDDDDVDNFSLKRSLEKLGVAEEIIVFQYADKALEFIETNERKIDLIFLDVNMPRMSGFEFLERYQEFEEPKRSNSVVMMLGAGMDSIDAKATERFSCVTAVYEKPLSRDAIIRAIETIGKA